MNADQKHKRGQIGSLPPFGVLLTYWIEMKALAWDWFPDEVATTAASPVVRAEGTITLTW